MSPSRSALTDTDNKETMMSALGITLHAATGGAR